MKEERGMGYRKISKWLNHSGITTHEGNTWGETGNSVYSVIKRMKEREQRLIQSNQNFTTFEQLHKLIIHELYFN